MPMPKQKPLTNTINLRLRQPRKGSYFDRLNRIMENANPSQPRVQLLLGDCLDLLPTLAANSIDAIVTDPPYGLSFMGATWDYDVPSIAIWRECWRVLKPGGHLLSFGGTRTTHRIAVAIEDAGFEIRDQVFWAYGQGMPKIHDIGKKIDKAANVKREVVGKSQSRQMALKPGKSTYVGGYQDRPDAPYITAPATDNAKKWDGWANCLKPAVEPIVVARKPIEKGLTLAANVVKYGTGALNIGATRVSGVGLQPPKDASSGYGGVWPKPAPRTESKSLGRYPANLIISDDPEVLLHFPTTTSSSGMKNKRTCTSWVTDFAPLDGISGYDDSGSTARFFKQIPVEEDAASRLLYIAKAKSSERNIGVEQHVTIVAGEEKTGNVHPTCKPVALMAYLVRLVTQPGGVVLDCFMGSGSTGIAAVQEGFRFIGIEREADYHAIAEKRIAAALSQTRKAA